MKIWWGTLAGALLAVAACDVIRYPGDGHENDYKTETPPGAPGPAPPSEPVADPYGDGTDDETEIPGTGSSGPETDMDLEPGPVAELEPANGENIDPSPPGETETETEVPSGEDTGELPAGPSVDPEADPATDAGTDTETDIDTGTAPDPANPGGPTDTAETPTEPEPTVVFSYVEPGQLLPGSGTGTPERDIVFAPDMRFPIKSDPAYLQSQVWMFGGGIKGGDQCDPRNFEYPWRDNFCETRSSNRNSPYCPVSKIHQGQDIRVGTPQGCNELRRTPAAQRDQYEVVATEDGVIQSIGTYTVTMRAGPRIYKYMHMNMAKLEVAAGDAVTEGQTLGYVSNDFGGTPTTYHLHFELLQNTAEDGWVHVPPYTSLVAAYERRENGTGEKIEANIGIASTPPPIPEGFVIIE